MRRGLQQAGGKVTGLCQQVHADLGYVRARRDVHEISLGVGLKAVATREVVQQPVDLLEVPGIPRIDQVEPDFGLG